jgi:hypothetical protein
MRSAEQEALLRGEPFSLALDQRNRLWLHTMLDGVPFALNLGDAARALDIMSTKIAEHRLGRVHAARDVFAGDDDTDLFDWE